MIAYGLRFGPNFLSLVRAPEIPSELCALREQVSGWAGVEPSRFSQALVQRFPPGASIGWHADDAAFGCPIIGISLGAPAVLRLRDAARETIWKATLQPSSIYSLSSDARWRWQHSITGVTSTRYSVTFRTVPTKEMIDDPTLRPRRLG